MAWLLSGVNANVRYCGRLALGATVARVVMQPAANSRPNRRAKAVRIVFMTISLGNVAATARATSPDPTPTRRSADSVRLPGRGGNSMAQTKIPASFLDIVNDKKSFAHLATLMPDGTPQVT